MGGGGMRSEETGQPAGRTIGMKGDGRNERRWQMGGGGVRSVIGHGILAGKYLAEYRDSLK